jgi:hypothetical protein
VSSYSRSSGAVCGLLSTDAASRPGVGRGFESCDLRGDLLTQASGRKVGFIDQTTNQ